MTYDTLRRGSTDGFHSELRKMKFKQRGEKKGTESPKAKQYRTQSNCRCINLSQSRKVENETMENEKKKKKISAPLVPDTQACAVRVDYCNNILPSLGECSCTQRRNEKRKKKKKKETNCTGLAFSSIKYKNNIFPSLVYYRKKSRTRPDVQPKINTRIVEGEPESSASLSTRSSRIDARSNASTRN